MKYFTLFTAAMMVLLLEVAAQNSQFSDINSRDNYSTNNNRRPRITAYAGYPGRGKRFPKAEHSGVKPPKRDIGGMENLTLANFNEIMDKKIAEFYQRIKANAKTDRVMARKMKKPQYSDPLYFGHKRKPIKRPVGKRKFCKECHIVH